MQDREFGQTPRFRRAKEAADAAGRKNWMHSASTSKSRQSGWRKYIDVWRKTEESFEMSKWKSQIKSLIRMITKTEKIPIPTPVNVPKVLEGKVALITGGTGGIGMAIAKAFLQSGGKVILLGTSEQKLADGIARLKEEQTAENRIEEAVKPLAFNLLDVEKMPDMVQKACGFFPEGRIDILVNCAGVNDADDFAHVKEADYDRVMDINVKGTFFMCQAVSNYMIEHKIKGHILNVSSSSALRPAWTPYPISKWAIRGFTMGLADTLLPHGIIVNAIAPGPTATAMVDRQADGDIRMDTSPSKRMAVPSEIANLAVFMVSDMGNMIVGDTFYMTGGSGTISMHH
jgi:3-oxoacyl-[acyl-carrier protein] reductase